MGPPASPSLLPMRGQGRACDVMVVSSQGDVDAAFADMEHLLLAERPAVARSGGVCADCGCGEFVYAGSGTPHPGSRVCTACGVVQGGNVYFETMYGSHVPTRGSNYKRIHHFHERISQLLLLESQIPDRDMLLIAEKLCDGTVDTLNKDTIRAVLRSLNMQLYIEKWLQIIHRLTNIAPPSPGPLMIRQLDNMFHELQRPFEAFKAPGRKNFLNYNYVFCRLFQAMGCARFSMFFPLIKSRSKLQSLDAMWSDMAGSINWDVTPLQQVPVFSVRLTEPAPSLARLASRSALQSPVERPIVLPRMGCRELRHWVPKFAAPPTPRPRQSDQPGPALQMLGLKRRRLR